MLRAPSVLPVASILARDWPQRWRHILTQSFISGLAQANFSSRNSVRSSRELVPATQAASLDNNTNTSAVMLLSLAERDEHGVLLILLAGGERRSATGRTRELPWQSTAVQRPPTRLLRARAAVRFGGSLACVRVRLKSLASCTTVRAAPGWAGVSSPGWTKLLRSGKVAAAVQGACSDRPDGVHR